MNKLVIFLKNPVPGKVKTRLAQEIGNERAVEIYRWLVRLTMKAIKNLQAEIYLYYNELPDNEESLQYDVHIQKGNSLGDKIMNAFIEQNDESGSCVIIGSDCPKIEKSDIEKSFHLLAKNELVLGPAQDGGVYLIGIQKTDKRLFEHIDWSTEKVKDQLIRNAKTLNWSTAILQVKDDIDRRVDFEKYKSLFEAEVNQLNRAV
jgi:rSAM/selenodomain-associated transferase 1